MGGKVIQELVRKYKMFPDNQFSKVSDWSIIDLIRYFLMAFNPNSYFVKEFLHFVNENKQRNNIHINYASLRYTL